MLDICTVIMDRSKCYPSAELDPGLSVPDRYRQLDRHAVRRASVFLGHHVGVDLRGCAVCRRLSKCPCRAFGTSLGIVASTGFATHRLVMGTARPRAGPRRGRVAPRALEGPWPPRRPSPSSSTSKPRAGSKVAGSPCSESSIQTCSICGVGHPLSSTTSSRTTASFGLRPAPCPAGFDVWKPAPIGD